MIDNLQRARIDYVDGLVHLVGEVVIEALRMLGDAVHVRKTLDHTQHLMSLGVDEVRVRAGRVGLDDARHLVGLRRQGCADDRAAQG